MWVSWDCSRRCESCHMVAYDFPQHRCLEGSAGVSHLIGEALRHLVLALVDEAAWHESPSMHIQREVHRVVELRWHDFRAIQLLIRIQVTTDGELKLVWVNATPSASLDINFMSQETLRHFFVEIVCGSRLAQVCSNSSCATPASPATLHAPSPWCP